MLSQVFLSGDILGASSKRKEKEAKKKLGDVNTNAKGRRTKGRRTKGKKNFLAEGNKDRRLIG